MCFGDSLLEKLFLKTKYENLLDIVIEEDTYGFRTCCVTVNLTTTLGLSGFVTSLMPHSSLGMGER